MTIEIYILSREQIRKILKMEQVFKGVEAVYQLKSQGKTEVWPHVAYDFIPEEGVMDIKSGYVKEMQLHGLKMLNSFPLNSEKGISTFNGMMMVFDSNTGIPLGVMDASYITCMRTGAAGAIGAKILARENSRNLLILGTGNQALYQIAATILLMPKINRVRIASPRNKDKELKFVTSIVGQIKEEFGIDVTETIQFEAVENLKEAVGDSDVIITITRSKSPIIQKEWVKKGTHFSCVGADMEGKQEIDPELFIGARIFVDDIPQCMKVGELEIPIKMGIVTEFDIVGEIGSVIEGEVTGRSSDEEITIYDTTGVALLDLITAKVAIDLAKEKGLGTFIEI
ncbi:ornithine cyclodeaminase family protein [Psychrobacillus sp. NEAU-3TGS]|uniref:ornithine cyclodeaminase family protein n=1 Tax=Psychrobacillus sp. NEAU-3TGS TaxID=2995412 RepID=UPI002495E5DF|nr:ornithine cyclodeaminase family protein [Psychrobacillus sp. NEAU-3TGS]MDI2586236.1 ornithine cyclodeaminase family protein [Psychrobacillus sp. NEAU-3TGS]